MKYKTIFNDETKTNDITYVPDGTIDEDDLFRIGNSFEEHIHSLLEHTKQTWNYAISTMEEVIELQPLIAQSVKDRIKEIAKGLLK